MQIIDNTAVQLQLPAHVASTVTSQIDKSHTLSTGSMHDVLVYWGYNEALHLSRILDEHRPNTSVPSVPSPMLRDYKWPGIYKPFEHQKDTASFLSLRHRAFCFNEAGTGKTSAAIWAADYLMNLGLVKRVLVICPMSIMYSAWQADIIKTAMHRTVAVAHGAAKKRKEIVGINYDFIIINFDGVGVIQQEIKNENFDLIIVDEANAYKSANTVRWKTLARLIMPSTRLWMMTGTPASQSPLDAFGLAKLVAPQRVPKFTTAWRDKVLVRVSKFKWDNKPNWRDDVHYALQPAIRYTKEECLDLPDVLYVTRDVPLTPQVMKYYKTLKKQMLIEAAGEQISAVNAAASMSKLLQISGGAVYTDNKDIVEFDVTPRLSALKEVLDETVHKVVVFVPYLHTIDIVQRFLLREGYSTEVVMGDVTARQRSEIFNKFQTLADPRVLIIQPQSASHGVTLTAADTVVFWSPVMSVETYLQCIARIDRVGQKNNMTVVHLQGSNEEKRVYRMLQNKVDSHQKLVELYKQSLEDEDE